MAIAVAVPGPCGAQGEPSWNSYQVIIWQGQTEAAYAALRSLGVTGAAVIPDRTRIDAVAAARAAGPVVAAGLRPYLENIATDFYAPYHRWQPGRAVNALYDETVARWRADSADPGVFVRDPSLFDPAWRERIAERLREIVAAYGPYHPFYYSLGDETGIADLSTPWDFDRSPQALAALRRWLAGRYPDLAALNAAWGTHFTRWDDVAPDTTFSAMRRADGSLASWSDFKAWMDASYADAVRMGTDAVHAADKQALAGIEGVQLPGWGGYDYATLAPAADVMEIYPDDVNLEIAQDLHPGLAVLTTSTPDPSAAPEIWRALFRGARGLIVWDDGGRLVGEDARIGPDGAAFAALVSRLRQAAPAIQGSEAVHDPVAILYSQASFRATWMDERRPQLDAWVAGGAEGEDGDNAWRHAMRAASDQLLHLGIRPRWIDDAQLAAGLGPETRVLLLPDAIALSDAAARAVAAFAASGGTVIADTAPAARNDRLQPRAPLGAAQGVHVLPGLWDTADGAAQRRMLGLLGAAGVAPLVTVVTEDGRPVSDLQIRLRKSVNAVVLLLQYDPGLVHKEMHITVHLDCATWARFWNAPLPDTATTELAPTGVTREDPVMMTVLNNLGRGIRGCDGREPGR